MSTDDPTAAPQPEASTTDPVPEYEIRVAGRLASRWSAWFDGLTIATDDDGTTVIRGPVVDQAALHGLLQKLRRDVGIPLLSLTQTPIRCTHRAPLLTQRRRRTEMTTTTHPITQKRTTAAGRTRMSPMRKAALIAGVAYIATFVFSIPVKFGLWTDVINKPNFVLGDERVRRAHGRPLRGGPHRSRGRGHRRRPLHDRQALQPPGGASGS